LERWPRG